jgi:hypothetical protein
VRAHTPAADDDDEGAAQPRQPGLGEEDPVPRQLFVDQLFVEVAGLCAARQLEVVLVVFVGVGDRFEGRGRLEAGRERENTVSTCRPAVRVEAMFKS